MRKEILIVITAGIFLGLLVAFGIWRANNALQSESSNQEPGEKIGGDAPTPTPEGGVPLTIAKPEENDVLVESNVLVSGITKPRAWITISTSEEDYILQSDNSGVFEQVVELTSGLNQLTIHSFTDTGHEAEQTVSVVYSSEFAKEISDQ